MFLLIQDQELSQRKLAILFSAFLSNRSPGLPENLDCLANLGSAKNLNSSSSLDISINIDPNGSTLTNRNPVLLYSQRGGNIASLSGGNS